MRNPPKRPTTLRSNFVYLLKEGTPTKLNWMTTKRIILKGPTKAIYCYRGGSSGLPYFRLLRRRARFIVLYSNRNVVKRLRAKTSSE